MLGPLGYEVNEMVSLLSSLQLRVLRLGLLQDRDVGVGVFPEGQEVLVCTLRFRCIACHRVGATELEMGQRAGHEVPYDASVIQQLLELGGCGSSVVGQQVGLATHV